MRPEGFTAVSEILRSGVYALVHRREVVYIGKSKTMLVRIYSHRNAWGDKRRGKWRQLPKNFPVQGIYFDEVFVRPVPVEHLDEVEREMIAKYRPKYNTLLKPPLPLNAILGLALPKTEPVPTLRRI